MGLIGDLALRSEFDCLREREREREDLGLVVVVVSGIV